jgi:two-component system CheB/CheR fusion protein
MSDKDFFIVGIGASAGGLDAIQQLFDNIPAETGMAFVIVQHLSPNFISLMPELLAKHTQMEIFTAENGQTLQPNSIYLNQKNKNLYIKGKQLFLTEISPKPNLNLPIDLFFHSLGEEHKDKVVGIILSGTGSDGSRGIKSIKEAGGILIVQEPDSAQFDGMPNTCIATNLVDFILKPEEIAETLIKISNHSIHQTEEEKEMKSNEVVYYQILDLVHKYSSIDFKQYKKNTLLRRLEKRMNIIKITTLDDYLAYLKSNPSEVNTLKQSFLIGVTRFFRDVEAFELLKTKVIPELCKNYKNIEEPLRVWVPGCSTGEEVYSIAILLDDHIKQARLNIGFKIFATDIDENALEIAGNGVYSPNSVSEVSRDIIESYFVNDAGNMKVVKRLRERIVFSKHNLLKDTPFIRLDLISCRNLLIYLEASIQQKVLMNFQFALRKNGFLLLGNSESLGHQSKFFKPISSKMKIYQCIVDTKRLPMQDLPDERISTMSFKNTQSPVHQRFEYQFKQDPESAFYKHMSQKFSPALVFIDSDFNILFVNGDITTRLSVNQGLFQSNLLKLVSKELASIIRSGIRKVEREEVEVLITDVVNKMGEQEYCFDLGFHKIKDFNGISNVYVVYFSNDKQHTSKKIITLKNTETNELSKQRIAELEDDLKDNKTRLQSVVEELETSNEELQASNEELMASNEELQSTNEELQSVNEELYTVNAELQEKNKELSYLNNDVNNLLNATEIGTLFLDVDLRIRRFTPALQKHFNLQSEDVGRSIASFASNFNEEDRKKMIEDCKAVLYQLKEMEAEVCDQEGDCFLRRISPFITADKKIEGLVITFVNITQVLQIENELKESEKLYKTVFTNAGLGITTVSPEGELLTVNRELENILGYSRAELTQMTFTELTHPDDQEADVVQFTKLMQGEINAYKMDKRYLHKKGHVVWGQLTVTSAKDDQNNILYSVALVKDISENKKAEDKLQLTTERLTEAQNIALLGNFEHDFKEDTLWWSEQSYKILGFKLSPKPPEYNVFVKRLSDDDAERLNKLLQRAEMHGEDYSLTFKYHLPETKEIKYIWLQAKVIFDDFNQPQGLKGIVQDVSEKRKMEIEKYIYLERMSSLMEYTDEGFYLFETKESVDVNLPLEKQLELIYSGTIVECNSAQAKMYGYKTPEDIVGKTLAELHGGNSNPENRSFIRSWIKEGYEIRNAVSEEKDKDGHTIYFSNNIIGIINKGKLERIWGTQKDITASVEYERSLKEAKRKAEVANIYKNQFLANMSHEIRTPMNGVVGFADLLDEDGIDPQTRKKFINIIKNSSNQLLNLINDIIDVSKIEANELKLEFKECKLKDLLENLEATFNETKKDKQHILLKCTIPKEHTNLSIQTDPLRLQQVLSNLMSNAFKFTDKGTVEFGFKVSTKNKITFFVKDSGSGIPKDKLDAIFNRFEQLKTGKHVKNDGTGLGLSISKGIVNLLEGNFKVDSEVGKGTIFTFTIPLIKGASSMKTKKNRSIEAKISEETTVLVADDEAVNIEYFKVLFDNLPINVIYAENGIAAVEAYRMNTNIDIVLMDIRMPEMDGVEATKEILKINPNAKIIAQTAYAMAADRDKYLAMGFVDYLSKPIDKAKLMKKLINLKIQN